MVSESVPYLKPLKQRTARFDFKKKFKGRENFFYIIKDTKIIEKWAKDTKR